MPIIKFSPKDKMLAVTMEAGYQPFRVTNIDGPKASKSGNSINLFIDFSVSSGKFEGKNITIAFTSGSESASLLGNLMWMPTANLRQVYAAIKVIPLSEVPDEVDTDDILNGQFDGKVEVVTLEGGGIGNTISQFLPLGKSAAAGKVPF